MDNQQPSNKEEWRVVLEYDRYEVNRYGEIRHRVRKQVLKPRPNPSGYLYVNFNIEGHRQNFAVHRVVANAFIPNPNYKPEVNHKDLNKNNNFVENLEWVDSSENKNHFHQTKTSTTLGKEVDQFSKSGVFIKRYKTVTEAAREVGCVVGAISNCCLGRTKTSMGYKWSFVEGSTTKYARNPSASAQDSLKEDEDIVSTSSES